MYEGSYPTKRYEITLGFLKKHLAKGSTILDLGEANPFSKIMTQEGFLVQNTTGEDLDDDQNAILQSDAEVVTAFEIFEHLLAPYNALKAVKAKKLFASVPLKLWFSPAYQSKTDLWDRHYHEFEPWQFDWLLAKSGWEIKDSIKWAHPPKQLGIRPILRRFTPRYYLVYAERTSK